MPLSASLSGVAMDDVLLNLCPWRQCVAGWIRHRRPTLEASNISLTKSAPPSSAEHNAKSVTVGMFRGCQCRAVPFCRHIERLGPSTHDFDTSSEVISGTSAFQAIFDWHDGVRVAPSTGWILMRAATDTTRLCQSLSPAKILQGQLPDAELRRGQL